MPLDINIALGSFLLSPWVATMEKVDTPSDSERKPSYSDERLDEKVKGACSASTALSLAVVGLPWFANSNVIFKIGWNLAVGVAPAKPTIRIWRR